MHVVFVLYVCSLLWLRGILHSNMAEKRPKRQRKVRSSTVSCLNDIFGAFGEKIVCVWRGRAESMLVIGLLIVLFKTMT